MAQKRTIAAFFTTIVAVLLVGSILVKTGSAQVEPTEGLEVSASASPARIHKGDNTTITIEISNATPSKTYIFGINVSSPVETSSALNITIKTNSEGLGSNSTEYWGAFPGANTTDEGTYSVTVRNATTKQALTTTSFMVEVWLCQVLARDLANKPVSSLTVNVYNKTTVAAQFVNVSRVTNDTGWASFTLGTGNYTFEALWKQVKVGNLPLTRIENDTTLEKERWIQLSNLKITVRDEATNDPLPFIQLRLEYNYTTEANENLTKTSYFETNFTGTAHVHNLFVNNSYIVEATRYGISGLSLPLIHNETLPLPWNNLTIEFPLYAASVQVVDSKNNAIEGFQVEAHEWSSGLAQSETTDSNGNVTLSLTFGRYIVRVFDRTVLLDESLLDLTQNQSSFLIQLSNYNVDLTVQVVDFFKQPISNAIVKIERRIDESYELVVPSDLTGSDGRVTFSGILGGDSRISVYVKGRLSGARDLYLADSKEVTFTLDKYVVFLSYVVETSQVVTAASLVILCVALVVALTYKKLLKVFVKSK